MNTLLFFFCLKKKTTHIIFVFSFILFIKKKLRTNQRPTCGWPTMRWAGHPKCSGGGRTTPDSIYGWSTTQGSGWPAICRFVIIYFFNSRFFFLYIKKEKEKEKRNNVIFL